jgi:phage terminase large subunit|tara:strand:- start:567 stop:1730 length:1164 start_codon:yes stop_codon:yes gene_type:complete
MQRIKTNVVFEHLQEATSRIIIEQGGTRSGKTYNILIWIICFCLDKKNKGNIITICRKTFPSVRASVMRDFFEILNNMNQYNPDFHNKSSNEYSLSGNMIEFISLDQPQKVRGRKRDMLYINEANELHFEDWQQLIMRTSGRIILDYNPSEEYHWIYDRVIPRDDSKFYKTTYKDNPFLSDTIRSEIERLKETDENYWQVYGLGERGQSKSVIFKHTQVESIPEGASLISAGMDFGFTNDPTTLVLAYRKDVDLFFDEMVYQTGLTNRDIHNRLLSLGFDRRTEIFADSAEPKSIKELQLFGWNIKPTAKGKDSVMAGIDMLKRYKLNVTKSSVNLIKELRNYKFVEDYNGKVLNKPVDEYNHAIDAMRYATYNRLSRPNYGRYAVR